MSRTATTAWEIDALQAALQPLAPGLRVEWVASTGSTNTDLLERMRMGDARPVLRVAEDQRSGRGRLGRNWVSAPGASLTFSLGLPYEPRQWSGLSLAIGAVLADAIEPRPQRLQLKWPNDLWLSDGRKLAGILVETATDTTGQRCLVVGIGLNLRPPPEQGLRTPAACLQDIDPRLDGPAALERIAVPLVRTLLGFAEAGFAPFRARFAQRDYLQGLAVTLGTGGQGTARGVDDDGALRVQTAQGVQRITSSEVSVRPAAHAG